MSDTDHRSRAPWHLWVLGLIALVWNGLWAFDYVMTQTQGDAWLAKMEPNATQWAYFHAIPAWVDGAQAVNVWGGVLGALLLLLRRRWATWAFAASFLGWLAGAVYAFALSNGMEAMGPWWPMQLVHGGVALFLVWYARGLSARGVLR